MGVWDVMGKFGFHIHCNLIVCHSLMDAIVTQLVGLNTEQHHYIDISIDCAAPSS